MLVVEVTAEEVEDMVPGLRGSSRVEMPEEEEG
jgi:hypothetical protein